MKTERRCLYCSFLSDDLGCILKEDMPVMPDWSCENFVPRWGIHNISISAHNTKTALIPRVCPQDRKDCCKCNHLVVYNEAKKIVVCNVYNSEANK